MKVKRKNVDTQGLGNGLNVKGEGKEGITFLTSWRALVRADKQS